MRKLNNRDAMAYAIYRWSDMNKRRQVSVDDALAMVDAQLEVCPALKEFVEREWVRALEPSRRRPKAPAYPPSKG